MSRALGRSHPCRGDGRTLTLAIATIGVLLGTPLAAFADWPQFQGDAAHGGLSDGPEAPLRVGWTNTDIDVHGPDARGGLSPPVVADDGTIVTVAPTAVLGFSSSDGASAFEAERDFGPSSQPAVAAGSDGPIVVFTEGYGDNPPAATASPSPSPSPTPDDDDDFDSHVDAVDLEGGTVWDSPAPLDALVLMPVAVDGETAYVGDVEGGVTAIALDSGDERWAADVGSPVAGAVSVDGDRAFVAALGSRQSAGAVVALDTASGEELWRTSEEAISGNPVSTPVIAGSSILVLDAAGVVSLDAEDGHLAWRTDIVNPLRSPPFLFQGTASPAPVSAGGSVYAVDVTGRVYALDAETGAIRWDHALNDASPVSPPIVASGQILVPTDSGSIDAIDRATGELVWRIDASGAGFLRGLADAGGTIVAVAGTDDPVLIAFDKDPEGTLIAEPSPTTFDVGRFVTGFLIGGLVFGAVLVALLRPVQRRLGPAVAAPSDGVLEEEP
jgi:outer membrane protein assembly factor BamB